jgi:hypothetical protein
LSVALARRLAAPADDGQLIRRKNGCLLDMTPAAIRQAAYRGALPYVKIGRRLRFRARRWPA